MKTDNPCDRRVRKTKKLLKDALLALLHEKDLNSITISELCNSIDINRNTFYYHYTHIGELIDEIVDDFLEETRIAAIDVTDAKKSILNEYQITYKNKRLYETFIIKNPNFHFISQLIQSGKESTIPGILAHRPDISPKDLDFAAQFTSIAFLSTMVSWLQKGYKTPPADEVEKLLSLIENGVYK